MADLELYQRSVSPRAVPLPKPSMALADRSGQISAGQAITGVSGDIFSNLIKAKANNEHNEFVGRINTAKQEFKNFLLEKPNASLEEIQKAKVEMLANIDKAGQGVETNLGKEYNKNFMLNNRTLIEGQVDGDILAIQTQREATRTKMVIENDIVPSMDKERLNKFIDDQVESGVIAPELSDITKKHYGKQIDAKLIYNNVAALKIMHKQTGDSSHIDKAKELALSTTLLDEKEKQALYANIESYEIQTQNRAKKDIYAYDLETTKELLSKLDKSDLDMDDVQAKYPKDIKTVEYFQGLIKGSKKEVVNTKPRGHNAALDIIYAVSAGDKGKLAAHKELATLRYDKGTINDEDYQWAKSRIDKPYPRDVSNNVRATIKSTDSWWTTKDEQKEQQAFIQWVEKQIADGKEPTLKEMKSVMSDLVSQKPILETEIGEEKRIEVIDKDGNLFSVPVSQFEIATKKYGFRAAE